MLYSNGIELNRTEPGMTHWDDCMQLYLDAFPSDERREIPQLLSMFGIKDYKFYSIINNDYFHGLLELWTFTNFIFLEHLAVIDKSRDKGIGKKVIELVKEKYNIPIILEAEQPIDDLSKRRIEFYHRCGFKILDVDYSQPPYYPGKQQVPMMLLANVHISSEFIDDCISVIRKIVYQAR